MGVNDNLLNNIAKALNSESYVTLSYLAVSTDSTFAASLTNTTIVGESPSRIATTSSRSANTVTFNAIRSGASVVDTTNGDTLYGAAWFSAVTAGQLQLDVALPSLIHTTAYDLETDLDLTTNRGS